MNLYKIAEQRWFFIATLVLFRLALELGYFVFVSPLFAYAGFVTDVNVLKYVESWVVLLVCACFLPCQGRRVSDYLVVFAYTGLLVPLLSLYALANHERWIVYAVFLQFALVLLFRSGKPIHISKVKGASSVMLWFTILVVCALSVWYVVSGGVRNMNFDLMRVYEFRAAAAADVAQGFLGYVNPWIWKVFGPLLLGIALYKRWWWLVLGMIASFVFWFSISNMKGVLFFPAVVLTIWFWCRRSDCLSIFPLGFSILVVAVIGSYVILGEVLFASLFVRRVFYVIANNTFDYYYFFSENAKVMWTSSGISLGLAQPIYDVVPAKVIGEWRGTAGENVNNSFLSTGYMHAGWWGILLYGVVAGLLFRLVDSVSRGSLPLWIPLSAFVIPGRSMVLSADLPTSLLTHGLGIAILVVWLINGNSPLQKASRQKRNIGMKVPTSLGMDKASI